MGKQFAKIFGYGALLPETAKGIVWIVDQFARVDAVHTIVGFGWVKPVIAFLNAIPHWLSLLLVPVGFIAIWWSLHQPRKSAEGPQMNAPKLCKDCRHSRPEPRSEWNLRCFHPEIIIRDAWALSSVNQPDGSGSECSVERAKSWSGKCGMRGAMWEPK